MAKKTVRALWILDGIAYLFIGILGVLNPKTIANTPRLYAFLIMLFGMSFFVTSKKLWGQ